MKTENMPKFFLAANSAEGFINEFPSNFSIDWTAYIIKGGAGTGKSTLMRRFAKRAEEKEIPFVLCPCSSDPDSLDSVILPTKKVIILDGTAPHIVEPKFPGVCEQIINTGEFWNANILRENRANIAKIMQKNKSEHKKAANCIRAAGNFKKACLNCYLNALNLNSCFNFAANLSKRYIKEQGDKALESVRFLGGITPKGYLYFKETLENTYNVIVLKDPYEVASTLTLSVIRDYALKLNHEIITVKNALLPSEIYDAIIIPKLNLAFVSQGENDIKTDNRKHNLGRFYDKEYLRQNKEKLRFNKKAQKELVNTACVILKHAKQSHDSIEEYYKSAMDYDSLNKFFDKFLDDCI